MELCFKRRSMGEYTIVIACIINPLNPLFMLMIGAIMCIELIGLVSCIRNYKRGRRNRLIAAIAILSVLLMFGLCIEIYLYVDNQYKTKYQSLDYSISLTSLSAKSELVYLPISQNSNLQNRLYIESGTGTMEIISTSYGTALKINFTNDIEVRGEIGSFSDFASYSLTMVNQTRRNETLWWLYDLELWIYYESADLVPHNCTFEVRLLHAFPRGAELWYCEGLMLEGWNTYWGHTYGFMALC